MMNKEIVMKPWNLLTKLEQYSCIYSDMHKDAYGCRPRNDTSSWTAEMFEAQFDQMAKVIDVQAQEAENEEKIAIDNFKSTILRFHAAGAGDERTALRWMVSAEDFHSPQCVEHYVWKQGMLFTDYGRKIVDMLNEMLFEKEAV